jgi:hypothetical protein
MIGSEKEVLSSQFSVLSKGPWPMGFSETEKLKTEN